jgi:hypothetical protein
VVRRYLPLSGESPSLRIGEAAGRSGLSVKAVRFYCDQGLIKPVGRSEGGYRLFDEQAVAELVLIRVFRTMDVSLDELARILQLRRSGTCNCSSLKISIEAKIASIDRRVSELFAMKEELDRLLRNWRDCGGSKVDSPD